MKANSNRLPYWDNLKAILIFCVVLGHFLSPVYQSNRLVETTYWFIYTFHMPAFIFVSGYFSNNYLKRERIDHSKLIGFVLLYLFFEVENWISIILIEHRLPMLNILTPVGAPWYLLCLVIWYILLPHIVWMKPKIVMIITILLGLIVGTDNNAGYFLAAERAIVFYPYFLAGYYFNRYRSVIPNSLIRSKRASICYLMVIVVVLFFWLPYLRAYLPITHGTFLYKDIFGSFTIKNLVYGILLRFLWYIETLFTIAAIMRIVPITYRIYTCIGERTLSIYILHRLIRDILNKGGLYVFFGSNIVLLANITIISVLVTIFTSLPIFAKFFNGFFKIDLSILRDNTIEEKK